MNTQRNPQHTMPLDVAALRTEGWRENTRDAQPVPASPTSQRKTIGEIISKKLKTPKSRVLAAVLATITIVTVIGGVTLLVRGSGRIGGSADQPFECSKDVFCSTHPDFDVHETFGSYYPMLKSLKPKMGNTSAPNDAGAIFSPPGELVTKLEKLELSMEQAHKLADYVAKSQGDPKELGEKIQDMVASKMTLPTEGSVEDQVRVISENVYGAMLNKRMPQSDGSGIIGKDLLMGGADKMFWALGDTEEHWTAGEKKHFGKVPFRTNIAGGIEKVVATLKGWKLDTVVKQDTPTLLGDMKGVVPATFGPMNLEPLLVQAMVNVKDKITMNDSAAGFNRHNAAMTSLLAILKRASVPRVVLGSKSSSGGYDQVVQVAELPTLRGISIMGFDFTTGTEIALQVQLPFAGPQKKNFPQAVNTIAKKQDTVAGIIEKEILPYTKDWRKENVENTASNFFNSGGVSVMGLSKLKYVELKSRSQQPKLVKQLTLFQKAFAQRMNVERQTYAHLMAQWRQEQMKIAAQGMQAPLGVDTIQFELVARLMNPGGTTAMMESQVQLSRAMAYTDEKGKGRVFLVQQSKPGHRTVVVSQPLDETASSPKAAGASKAKKGGEINVVKPDKIMNLITTPRALIYISGKIIAPKTGEELEDMMQVLEVLLTGESVEVRQGMTLRTKHNGDFGQQKVTSITLPQKDLETLKKFAQAQQKQQQQRKSSLPQRAALMGASLSLASSEFGAKVLSDVVAENNNLGGEDHNVNNRYNSILGGLATTGAAHEVLGEEIVGKDMHAFMKDPAGYLLKENCNACNGGCSNTADDSITQTFAPKSQGGPVQAHGQPRMPSINPVRKEVTMVTSFDYEGLGGGVSGKDDRVMRALQDTMEQCMRCAESDYEKKGFCEFGPDMEKLNMTMPRNKNEKAQKVSQRDQIEVDNMFAHHENDGGRAFKLSILGCSRFREMQVDKFRKSGKLFKFYTRNMKPAKKEADFANQGGQADDEGADQTEGVKQADGSVKQVDDSKNAILEDLKETFQRRLPKNIKFHTVILGSHGAGQVPLSHMFQMEEMDAYTSLLAPRIDVSRATQQDPSWVYYMSCFGARDHWSRNSIAKDIYSLITKKNPALLKAAGEKKFTLVSSGHSIFELGTTMGGVNEEPLNFWMDGMERTISYPKRFAQRLYLWKETPTSKYSARWGHPTDSSKRHPKGKFATMFVQSSAGKKGGMVIKAGFSDSTNPIEAMTCHGGGSLKEKKNCYAVALENSGSREALNDPYDLAFVYGPDFEHDALKDGTLFAENIRNAGSFDAAGGKTSELASGKMVQLKSLSEAKAWIMGAGLRSHFQENKPDNLNPAMRFVAANHLPDSYLVKSSTWIQNSPSEDEKAITALKNKLLHPFFRTSLGKAYQESWKIGVEAQMLKAHRMVLVNPRAHNNQNNKAIKDAMTRKRSRRNQNAPPAVPNGSPVINSKPAGVPNVKAPAAKPPTPAKQ